MTNHPTLDFADVFAATILTLTFVSGVHFNSAKTELHIRDSLLRLKEFPVEAGGSGETIPA